MRTRQMFVLCVILLVPMIFSLQSISAQISGNYDLEWNTWDGGGGTSSGGSYEISGTIGQPDTAFMSCGNYTLSGGFWSGIVSSSSPQHKFNIWYLY